MAILKEFADLTLLFFVKGMVSRRFEGSQIPKTAGPKEKLSKILLGEALEFDWKFSTLRVF